jgi:hypothetical protein
MGNYRWRFTVNVTHSEYSSVIELSRKVKTSPSALVQHAIKKMLADAENALPLIPPASALPECPPYLIPAGSFIPAPDRD